MNIDKCREMFETTFIQDSPVWRSMLERDEGEDGEYVLDSTEYHWQIWKAAWETCERLNKLR